MLYFYDPITNTILIKDKMEPQIINNFLSIKEALNAISQKFGIRKVSLPKIVAVSKNHEKESILPLLEHGHRVFGENRVQEAYAKWPALKEKYPDIELHLIGPLQTNKAKEAVKLFDFIETVDREKLADALVKEMKVQNRVVSCFIQVNTGEEGQKAGISPKEADAFIKYCIGEGLPVKGLMCIPPVGEESALHFALLKKIAERNSLKELSMGMSGDYETAAAMGATYIRVGTAIFGERKN